METLKNELKQYRDYFSKELHEDILPYWMKYGVEKNGHGFYGAVDLDENLVLSANKTSVLNARILWTFSAAAMLNGNHDYEAIADKAYKVVTEDFEDKEFGGYYMELSSDNQVANDIKHTYAQAFVIYALCKYYEFRPLESVMQKIQQLFMLLEEMTKDPENIGYRESFTRDWKIYGENRMADNNEPKSMNTHLHVLEAWAALYKVWKDPKVEVRLTELMNLFLDKIIRKDGNFGIFFDEAFNEVESSRFGSHVKTNKHWWQQAETLVGFMNAFGLTGDTKYWETVKLSWNFINTCLIDHERGEWFTKLNRLGVPYLIEPADDPSPYYRNDWKIDPWKCPYHNGRAMMEMMKRIDLMVNAE